MRHLSEQQLVFYYYREAGEPEAIEQHLASCLSCRDAYQALERALAIVDESPVPERAEDYASQVWHRLRPHLEAREQGRWRWTAFLVPRRWAVVGAVAALCLIAFLAGHFWPRRQTQVAPAPIGAEVRERILLVAVDEHLERSQMVLVELVNSPGPGGKSGVDISFERERAQDLVEANRLYRQVAARAGEAGMASVLDDLERVLIEIAHSPSQVSSTELKELQRRIEAQGILFKVRVVGSQVQEREKSSVGRPVGASL